MKAMLHNVKNGILSRMKKLHNYSLKIMYAPNKSVKGF